jgi:drug/metabolite transporter (DMT)-like permease
MLSKHKKWLYLITLSVIWGSSFILIKKSLLGLTALQLGALRTIISGFFILLIGAYKLKHLTKEEWKWIIIGGLLGTFFPAFLFAFAVTEIDSAVASILNSLTPLNTVLLGYFLFNIYFSKKQIMGILIGLLGTIILIGAGMQLNPNQNYFYTFLVIAATFMYAINTNIIKRYLQDTSALAIAAGNFTIVIIPAFIVLLYTGFFKLEVLQQPELKKAMLYVIILALFGTAMAKVMYNKMVQMSTPVFASSVTYLIPIVALFWGLIDGENFNLIQGIGAFLILLGVYMANFRN